MILILLLCSKYVWGQQKNLSYDFYGFIRGDLFYNSRKSVAPVDGNFYLFPLDRQLDADGRDLNETGSGDFVTYTSRLGLNVKGLKLGCGQLAANIEMDFGGSGKDVAVIRLRKAYLAYDWGKHRVLAGQTWHPLFGSVVPDILNLSTGAPFQPFNRSPQLQYRFKNHAVTLTASMLWQIQYKSNGPKGPQADYLKNSLIPELYVGADWHVATNLLLGGGVHLLSICPRTESEWNGQVYKVNERMTTTSFEGHLSYRTPQWALAAKSLLASSLDHTALLGGYGVHAVDPATGERSYTPFRHSTTWANVTYGNKWKPSLFIGFTKNLGTTKSLTADKTIYGSGLDIDQLLNVQLGFSYNTSHLQIGLEGALCNAAYGTISLNDGKVDHTHSVKNYRLLGLVMYYF